MADLTEVGLIKQHALSSNSILNIIGQAIQQPLIILNQDGEVIFSNSAVQQLCFKVQRAFFTPLKHYHSLIKPEQDSIILFIKESLSTPNSFSRTLEIGRKTVVAESKIISSEDNNLVYSITFTDMTRLIRKEQQHELLYQISSALAGVSQMDQVLTVAINQIMRAMEVSQATIMLLNQQTKMLEVKIHSAHPDCHDCRSFQVGEGVAGRCAADLKPYSEYDVTHSELFAKRSSDDCGAILAIPLISRGHLMGVINVISNTPRYFTESEVQFLTIMANDIAIALENSFIYERLNHKIKLLSKLFWISSFAGIRTLDNRLQRIVGLVADLMDAEDSCIYLYSPVRHKLVLRYQKDPNTQLPLQMDLKQEGLTKAVFQSQEIQILNDLTPAADPVLFKDYPTAKNIVCLPLTVDQKHIGILYVMNKRTGPFDEDDKHLLAITAHRIVTIIENAQLLRKVQAEKDLLDSIIKNTNEGVVVLNNKKRIVIWNRYLEQLTGLDAHEVIGLPCYKIFFSRLRLRKLSEKLYSNESEEEDDSGLIEEQMHTRSSEKIWISCLYSHLHNQGAKPEYTIMVIRNISKDKELIEAKNEFVSLATHELRTPLTAIKGYLSMILHGDVGTINPVQKRYFKKTFDATERLVGLVEELLDVVRIDENRLQFSPDLISIHSLISECIEDLVTKAKIKNITISNRTDRSAMIWADRDKTKQIFSNLIDNALKYTRDRGKVEIGSELGLTETVIFITDTGVGIPMNQADLIFDRFVRLPNPLSVKAGGTGLGLFIVKQFVEKQGGNIRVMSQLKRGSTFTVSFPNQMPDSDPIVLKGAHEISPV